MCTGTCNFSAKIVQAERKSKFTCILPGRSLSEPGFVPGKINKNNPKRGAFFLRSEIYLAIFVFLKFFYLYLC
jgi:hypothetical protein